MSIVQKDTRDMTKSRIVPVRMDEYQYSELIDFSDRVNVRPSVVMRAAVMDVVHNQGEPIELQRLTYPQECKDLPDEVKALRKTLKPLATNVNQLARLSNINKSVTITNRDDIPEVVPLLTEVKDILKELLLYVGDERL